MPQSIISIIFNFTLNDNLDNSIDLCDKISDHTLIISASSIEQASSSAITYSHYTNIHDSLKKCNDFIKKYKASDILFLSTDNVDIEIFDEMHKLLYLSERHCAVSPRGFDFGLQSLPLFGKMTPDKSQICFSNIKKYLARYHIAPFASGKAVLLKGRLVNKFGLFDEECASIDDAVASWCLRLSQYGYSSISANQVFVRNAYDSAIATEKTYSKKFDYANKLETDYIKYYISPFERFAATLTNGYYDRPKILLSLYQLTPNYNGTSENAFALIDALTANYTDKYDFYILTNRENALFFNIPNKYKNIVYTDSISGVYHLGITFTQIFLKEHLVILNKYCMKIIPTVLDLISYRCAQFSTFIDTQVFIKSIEYCDGILAISKFTKNDIIAAFPYIKDWYGLEIKAIPISVSNNQNRNITNKDRSIPFDKYILILGYPNKHKLLDEIFPLLKDINYNFILVGYNRPCEEPNIHVYPSGRLSYDFIDNLYNYCSALLFPSEYEGYGLPVVNSLQKNKKVIVSRTETNIEIQNLFPQCSDNFIYFDTFDEIKGIIETADFNEKVEFIDLKYSYGEAVIETEAFISKILAEPINNSRLKIRDDIVTTLEFVTQPIKCDLRSYLKSCHPNFFNVLKTGYSFIKHIKQAVSSK